MKMVKYLLLLGGLLATSIGAFAQGDDPYLDDAYMSRRDVERRMAKQKAEEQARAEARYRARLEAEKAEAEATAKALAEYKQRMRDREIDAYNGRLTPQDSLELQQAYEEEYKRAMRKHQREPRVSVYGPYSQRLARFHGDGQVIISDPDYVYIDEGSPYGDTNVYISFNRGWGWGSSWYDPWYDRFYGHRYGWGYSRFGWWGYYDPWYDPWYDSWYYPGYGRYYGRYYGYYDAWDYYASIANYRYYNHNRYREASRSSGYRGDYYTRPSRTTAYGSWQSARAEIEAGRSGDFGGTYRSREGSSSSGSTYRGRGRSTYTGASSSYGSSSSRGYTNSPRSYEADRSSGSSYNSTRSYDRSSSSSSSGSSSSSRSSGGGGGGFRGRR